MGFVYLNSVGFGLKLDRAGPVHSRCKNFYWVPVEQADVFESKQPVKSLIELARAPRKRAIREISNVEQAEHKLVYAIRKIIEEG